ncbi:MAG TPA: condensation domain-containing protein [Trebonia sp.]|nr:condensation domain-containing protein [Trebonia sp.]
MTDTVIVRFEGDGSGVADLTWGQHEIWRVMRDKGDSLPIGGVRALPPGQTVADVAAGLGFIMSRHQSLRTRLRLAPEGLPQQVVHARGEIALEVVDAGDGDPAEAAAAVVAGYASRNFDYEREWPARMAVITRRGTATHVAEIYCHLAMDGFGLAALRADLARRDDPTGPEPGPVTAVQPLEQARRQGGAAGRRAHDASMRYFERLAASAPDRQFSELAERRQPRFLQIVCESPAGYRAMRTLAARLGVGTSPVLLAAYAIALRPLAGSPSVAVHLVVNNRFRPGLGDSVSTLAQSCPCLIEVADAPFDEVAVRAWRSALMAYKHAYYDPAGKDEVRRRIAAERGAEPALGVFFNDLRVRSRELADSVPADAAESWPALAEELERSTLTWGDGNDVPADPMFLSINDTPGTLRYELAADSRFVSPADMAGLMRRIETVLVDAAVGAAAPALDGVR